jgi:hypothetical protein
MQAQVIVECIGGLVFSLFAAVIAFKILNDLWSE